MSPVPESRRAATAAVLLLLVAPPASRANPIEAARLLHERGVRGDREAVRECVTLLEQRVADHPEDAVARAWLGSALTLRARDLGIGPAKLETLKRGCRLMDQAVADSNAPEARLVRAINSAHLPALFGRRQIARTDFERLLQQARDPNRPLPAPLAQGIFLKAGDFLAQKGRLAEARTAWAEGVRAAPHTPIARTLREQLERHPES